MSWGSDLFKEEKKVLGVKYLCSAWKVCRWVRRMWKLLFVSVNLCVCVFTCTHACVSREFWNGKKSMWSWSRGMRKGDTSKKIDSIQRTKMTIVPSETASLSGNRTSNVRTCWGYQTNSKGKHIEPLSSFLFNVPFGFFWLTGGGMGPSSWWKDGRLHITIQTRNALNLASGNEHNEATIIWKQWHQKKLVMN